MIKPFDLEAHLQQLAMASQPSNSALAIRRIVENAGKKNTPASRSMPSIFPSQKMGGISMMTGSALECANRVANLESNPALVGFVTQPDERFKISWTAADGSVDGVSHQPDALVINALPAKMSADWMPATFQEVKAISYLRDHVACGKGRYVFDEATGRYRCPAAEKVAKEVYNFGYMVVTDADIDHVLAGNLDYLTDYARPNTPNVPGNVDRDVRAHVALHQGIAMSELLRSVEGLTADRLFTMIVRGRIFVPLNEHDIRETRLMRVYSDEIVAEAHKVMVRTQDSTYTVMRPPTFATGERLQIRSVDFEVVAGGDDQVVRLREEATRAFTCMRRDHILLAHRDGKVRSLGVISEREKKAQDILRATSPERLAAALERFLPIEPYIATNKRRASKNESPLTASNRHYLARCREALREYGNAFIGCIDRLNQRGRHSNLNEQQQRLIADAIEKFYLNANPGTKGEVYDAYKELCKAAPDGRIDPVSSKTFFKRLKKLAPHKVVQAQAGDMAAAQVAPPVTDVFSIFSDAKYFLHICHMDEVVFDLAVIDPDLGRALGTVWVVILFDAYTRSVVEFFVSFEEPSYVSTTLPVIRKCVRRWKRCPHTVITDRGSAFKGNYVAAAEYCGFRVTYRPAGMPRGGAQLERFNGDLNRRVADKLHGHTKIFNKYRRVSKTHDPSECAVHCADEVSSMLGMFFFETFDNLPHSGLNNRTPRQMRELSLARDGERKHLQIEPDSAFDIMTLPQPRGDGTAVVQAKDGVQMHGLYYWHGHFGSTAELIGKRVMLRWDPCDITRVFAFFGGRWNECECLKLRYLRKLSREQMGLVTVLIRREFRKRNKNIEAAITAVRNMVNSVKRSDEEVDAIMHARQAFAGLEGVMPTFDIGESNEGTVPAQEPERVPAGVGVGGQCPRVEIPGLPTSYRGGGR